MKTRIVRVLLQRSKAHPLDMEVRLVHKGSYAQPLWELLLGSSHRWQTFLLNTGHQIDVTDDPFGGRAPSPLPLLRHLDTDCPYPTSFFQDASRLRSFRCNGSGTFHLQNIPAAQVTYLELGHYNRAFGRFHQAGHVTIFVDAGKADPLEVDLSNQCRTLVLDFAEKDNLEFVSPALAFQPSSALNELVITGPRGCSPPCMISVHVKDVVDQSHSLASLFLDRLKMTPSTFLTILSLIPSLTHLAVDEVPCHVSDTRLPNQDSELQFGYLLSFPWVLCSLQETNANGLGFKLLPHLERIELKIHCKKVPDKAIAGFAAARALECLRVFKLHVKDRLLKGKEFDRLRGLVGTAFRAEITGTKAPLQKVESEDLTDRW